MLLDCYKELLEKLYIEPKNEIITGDFLTSAAKPNIQHKKVEIQDQREKSRTTRTTISQKIFSKLSKQNNEQKNTESKKKTNCIVTD